MLDITQYRDSPDSLGQSMYSIAFANIGKDITHIVSSSGLTTQANCLADIYQIAYVDLSSAGCFISNIILYVSLIFIGGVVLVRFFIALFFGLFVGWRQGDRDKSFLNAVPLSQAQRNAKSKTTQFDRDIHSQRTSALPSSRQANDAKSPDPFATNADLLHCLVMVPCYSEGLDSMKTTIQSIVDSDYPSTHKCIFVIADGIVQGSGNDKPTFEFVIDMMEIDYRFSKEDPKNGGSPPAYSYVAIADGTKRKNMAKVYAGWYKTDLERSTSAETLSNPESFEDEEFPRSSGIQYTLHERSRGRVPMILVVKVGNEEEQQPGQKKPGNRGKRDSQVILMNFLSKVMFDDRMTELEFEIFLKLWTLSGIMPEKYETVMMVDADTKIHTSALRHLLAAMSKDTDIIGICGETRVGNKWQSWVTMIQVFECNILFHSFFI